MARGASSNVNMDAEKQNLDLIHELDMEYQEATHKTRMVLRDEEARRLKLRSLLLQDDNAVVRDELGRRNALIKDLKAKLNSTQQQVEVWMDKARSTEKKVLAQARELANLKEEILSLSSATNDSAKILTEKLALSREIALLKPENEHLKAQLAREKDVLTEKLAIERQLQELELELANEKRAAEKAARQQQGKDSEVEEELRQQVQSLEKQLAKEKRAVQKATEGQQARLAENAELQEVREQLADAEKKLAAEQRAAAKLAKAKNVGNTESAAEMEQLRTKLAEVERALDDERRDKERVRKEGEKAVAEAEGLRLPLEERLDNLKSKLRETRAELKTCRADLERAQEATTTMTTKVPTKKAAPAMATATKKRRAYELSVHDSILETPNPPKRTSKNMFAPAAVGEKSTFSITPFLNKTINLTDAALNPITEDGEDEEEEGENQTETVQEPTVKSKTKKPLDEAPTTTTKHNMPPPPKPKGRKLPTAEVTLENVIEEPEDDDQVIPTGDQENRPLSADTTEESADPAPKKKRMVLKSRTAAAGKVATVTAAAAPVVVEQQQAVKKKRKLLGGQASVLLDDAEDAIPAVALPVVKRAPLKAGLAAKRAVGLGPGAAAGGAFGKPFSPLKRDRRGVGASFLA